MDYKTIYLNGKKHLTQDGHEIHCDFQSQAVIFLLHFCNAKSFRVSFVRSSNEDFPCRLCSSALSGFQADFIDLHKAPDSVQACCLPAILSPGEALIRVGFGCTLRHIVMVEHSAQPDSTLKALLGLKEVCLKSCAESSVWTRYCEVEVANLLKSVLKSEGGELSFENGEYNFKVPTEIVKLENYFRSPAIIRNRAKHKRAAVKKLLESKNKNSNQSAKTNITQSQITQVLHEVDGLEELQHRYVEGMDMTLSDVVLYPAFIPMLDKWKSIGKCLEEHLPHISNWLIRMREDGRVIQAHHNCGLPELTSNPANNPVVVVLPPTSEKLLNIRESKKKVKIRPEVIGEIHAKLKFSGINVTDINHPWESTALDWTSMPPETHPKDGELPLVRLERKCRQLENLVASVRWVAKPGDTIVDFCAGGGHLGIILAYLLPDCEVIMVENKEESISRAQRRIEGLGLKNATLYQCNLDYFKGNFDVGVCLHACGVATDLVLQTCLRKKASFVLCPCCYGSIHDNHVTTYPRSQSYKKAGLSIKEYELLGHAGDQTEVNIALASQGKLCMQLIDTDRLQEAEELGYQVLLTSLKPLSCSPKNNLLLGIRNTT